MGEPGERALVPLTLEEFSGKRIPAILAALVLGPLGAHKVVLGKPGPAVVMFLVTSLSLGIALPVTWAIALVEAFLYAFRSNDATYRRYVLERRGWL